MMHRIDIIIIVLPLIYGVLLTASEAVGEVRLAFFFQNPNGVLATGESCDSWPDTACDTYLETCISSDQSKSCDVYSQATPVWKDKNIGSFSVRFALHEPVPKHLRIKIEAWDDDPGGSRSLIGRFTSYLTVSDIPNTAAPVRIDRGSFSLVTLEGYGHIRCARFFYGGDCSRKCVPNDERYICTMEGFKQCKTGYLGIECEQKDYCRNHTCAAFAECRNTPTTFQCWCDNHEGSECYLGFDPCDPARKPCSDHGVCRRTGHRNITFACACDPYWKGVRCFKRRPTCAVAKALNETLCLHGGVCEDLGNGEDGEYKCVCGAGWWGQRCQKKLAFIYHNAFIFTLPVIGAVVLLSLGTFLVVMCCKKKKKESKPRYSCTSSRDVLLLNNDYRKTSSVDGCDLVPMNRRSNPNRVTFSADTMSPVTECSFVSSGDPRFQKPESKVSFATPTVLFFVPETNAGRLLVNNDV